MSRFLNTDTGSCWVCGLRFKNSTPPGPGMREDHHVFPRNAGGDEGPLVALCNVHHSLAHKIASRLHKNKPCKDLLAGESSPRIIWLAQQIVKAENFAKDDPNKLLLNGVKLSKTESEMVSRLQKHYSKPRADIFKAAIYLLFKETFK